MELKEIERIIITKYRRQLYRPFIRAIQEFELLQPGDKVAVCISGGKDSLLLAKLFQELLRHSEIDFECKFLVMNPGFNEENLEQLKKNAEHLNIPIKIKDSNIFEISTKMDPEKPCYLCARMRRGFLYQFAKEEGCNKIALAHHMNDVIETTMLNVLYSGTFKTMVPKLKSQNFEGLELIRPLVYVLEKDVIQFMKNAEIQAMNCGCKVTRSEVDSKRKIVKKLIEKFKKEEYENVEMSIFRSAQTVNLNCCLGWKLEESEYSFLDNYNNKIGENETAD